MSYDKCGCREQSWAGEHDDECPIQQARQEAATADALTRSVIAAREHAEATLTAERDEARAEIERLREELTNEDYEMNRETGEPAIGWQATALMLAAEVERLNEVVHRMHGELARRDTTIQRVRTVRDETELANRNSRLWQRLDAALDEEQP